jgi:hypothetical protein
MMNLKLPLTLILGALALPAAVIYQQNFESTPLGTPPSEFNGGAVESTGSFSAFGLGSRHLRNSDAGQPTTFLSLSGLAAHSSITISFDLLVWDSMDAPKSFRLTYDGFTLINSTNTSNYANNGDVFAGPGTLISGNVIDFSNPNYGNNASFRDQARRISGLTFNHTASTLTFAFEYTSTVTGGNDESFGIDNIVISSDAVENTGVPEPSTFAMAAGALLLLRFAKKN